MTLRKAVADCRMRARRLALALALPFALALAPGFPTAALAQGDVPTLRFSVDGFAIEGDNPLPAAETDALLAPFAGEYEGIDGLLEAATTLEDAIRARGFAFHRVVLPPQELEAATVTLRVVAFRLSSLDVRGNSQFTNGNIRRSLPSLEVGAVPNHRQLAREMELANRHPSKQVEVNFRASDEADEALAGEVKVDEGKTWSAFANLANVGNSPTGPLRTTFGVRATNLWDRDHVFSANLVTSPGHAGRTEQYAASYWAPVYSRTGALTFYALRSEASVALINTSADASTAIGGGAGVVTTSRFANPNFDVNGVGQFIGVGYTHLLAQHGKTKHEARIALDDKRFTNNVVADIFPGVNLGRDVRSRPITVGYSATHEATDWVASFAIDYARNTMSGGGNNGTAYRANRLGAESHWDHLRGAATFDFPLPAAWSGRAIFSGQYANEPLIPGEQIGIGGMTSVRGFSEREVTGDDGLRATLELWVPPVEGTDARFLFFADGGHVARKTTNPGQANQDGIMSIGGGTRWHYKNNVALSFDIGIVIEGTATRESGGRGHLNVLVSY